MSVLRTIGTAGAVAAMLLSATVVFAGEPLPSPSASPRPSKVPGAMNRPAKVGSTTPADKAKEARERMEQKREEAQERMAAKREKAEERLQKIQDKAKREKAERLAAQFDKTNKAWTDHFMMVLDQLDGVLKKIEARVATAAASGKNVASADAAIQSAKTAIANARTAVVAQAGKSYALDTSTLSAADTITAEGQARLNATVKSSFQTLHRNLFRDLMALRDGVMKNARTAVQNAHKALTQIPGVDQGTVTPSPSASSSQ